MPLEIYDTLRRAQVPFEPREDGRASIYVCGPTVQADAHIGHGRYAVVFDVLRRYLLWSGYDVLYVTNITDVDDKIIFRADREDVSAPRIAERYARAWNRTMDRLGVLPPDIQPRATGHILEMQQLISTLIERGKAYEADGNVLFRVRKFDEYGKLSNRSIEDMVQGDELVGAELKEDPLDFALWKAAKEGEPAWPSPWGPGRPGWHIECSVMASTHLGGGFDIHGGGLDLVFPHHENEIAQYEAVNDEPFARYWMHNGMVQMGTEKMSKSIGNIVGLEEAIERWGRPALRMWYSQAAHRSPLTFDEERVAEAVAAVDRLATFLRTVQFVVGDDEPATSEAAEPHRDAFVAAMDDDLNVPRATAALHELVTEGHDRLGAAERGDEAAIADVRALADLLRELADDVLGLGLTDLLDESRDIGRHIGPLVEHLLEARAEARQERDFASADAIRDRLAAAGVVIEDRPGGSRWYVEPGGWDSGA
ncbi:MAG: cysteine--tRNA ligase [Nitriliruptorales bacterium]|nr:cysteine--tRNA ligase [Nitriliruptorales bacterium]